MEAQSAVDLVCERAFHPLLKSPGISDDRFQSLGVVLQIRDMIRKTVPLGDCALQIRHVFGEAANVSVPLGDCALRRGPSTVAVNDGDRVARGKGRATLLLPRRR